MLRVGLTGGIACGKSHVLRRLAARGLAVLDLDLVARRAMAPGERAFEAVVAEFGRGILAADGSIDRARLGGVVFGDPAARTRLDELVHPVVRVEEMRIARELELRGQPLLVTDAALLVEAGAHLRFARLVVVACDPEEQLVRLVRRDSLSETAARARIEAQMPTREKQQFGHFVVDTSGEPARTDAAADALAAQLLALAARAPSAARLVADAVAPALHAAGPDGPRGLGAAALLRDALEAGGLELRRLARLLDDAADAPWYRQARPGEAGPWPEALAVPLALWTLHEGHDRDWLCLAAASVARLSHGDGPSVSGAALSAMVALAVARGEGPATLPERLHGWAAEAMRWGDALPAQRVERAVEAAAAAAPDSRRAWIGAADANAEPAFAAALVALASGAAAEPAAPELAELARRLAAA